jgi:pyruvate ferredoxin oxidoreductase gamma subunit
MFQVRLHGRGGQGVVTAAELLSVAAFGEGKDAQAFPSFGSERMGAPVMSFCRIDDKPIRLREPVANPDAVIIQDPTLLKGADLLADLKPQGYVLVNSPRTIEELGLAPLAARLPAGRVRAVPATDIAMAHLKRPLPNAALLGGFVALTGILKLESLLAAIRERFPGKVGDLNAAAAAQAYAAVAAIAAVTATTADPVRPAAPARA